MVCRYVYYDYCIFCVAWVIGKNFFTLIYYPTVDCAGIGTTFGLLRPKPFIPWGVVPLSVKMECGGLPKVPFPSVKLLFFGN